MSPAGWGHRASGTSRWLRGLATRSRRELRIVTTSALGKDTSHRPKVATSPSGPGNRGLVLGYDAAGEFTLQVYNRLDKVVMQLSRPGRSSLVEPIHPADARNLAVALQEAADAAERTPPN